MMKKFKERYHCKMIWIVGKFSLERFQMQNLILIHLHM